MRKSKVEERFADEEKKASPGLGNDQERIELERKELEMVKEYGVNLFQENQRAKHWEA